MHTYDATTDIHKIFMSLFINKKLLFVLLSISIMLLIFQQTFISMVSIWWRSETFAHGFLIIPISAYLIWDKRNQLLATNARIDFRILPVLALFGFVWMLSRSIDVLVVQQFSYVAMVVSLVWLLTGWSVVRIILFPLGFLFFMVPFGEALIPIMMDYTAIFVVKALRLTGIPVYWEGTFFSIPSGNWSVVEGCSGVRYLIASITLGSLYAYLSYNSMLRRLAFIVLAISFPIVANWLRAYMIVMIADLSGMKLALGVDHIIYGWVFFGIVMILMFWIGSFWQDKTSDVPEEDIKDAIDNNRDSVRRYASGLLSGLIAISVWPVWAYYQDANSNLPDEVQLELPASISTWASSENFADWKPRYIKSSLEYSQTYKSGGNGVGIYIFYYDHSDESGELITSQNYLVQQKDPVWRELNVDTIEIHVGSQSLDIIESKLSSKNQDLLVWHWGWVGNQYFSNPYLGKFYELTAKLSGGRYDGFGIVVYTTINNEVDDARSALKLFVHDMLPILNNNIEGGSYSP